jgi:hypothetical protein
LFALALAVPPAPAAGKRARSNGVGDEAVSFELRTLVEQERDSPLLRALPVRIVVAVAPLP